MIQTTRDRNGVPTASLAPVFAGSVRLDVVRPMLGDLDTATIAGQHYVMDKVLRQLREAAAGTESNLPDPERCAIRNTLAELARESEKLRPNADAFALRAQMLADTLSVI